MVALAVVVLAGVLSAPAAAATCTDSFIPASGDWATGSNWSLGNSPTSSDVACWNSGQVVTVTTAGNLAGSIQAPSGDLSITGGGLTLAGTTDDSAVNNLSLEGGGELDGPSGRTLTVAGNFDWGGTGSGTAALNAAAGAGLAISQTAGSTGSLTIDGTTSTPSFDGGSITTNSPVTISNSNFTYANAPTLTANDGVTFSGVTVAANGTPGTINATSVTNTGTSSVLGFTVHLTGGQTSSIAGSLLLARLNTDSATTLPVASAATLSVENGTIGGTISGAGTFTATAGTTTIASTGTLSTIVQVAGGNLTVNSGGTYSATSTSVSAGNLELDANAATGDLSITGGGLNSTASSTLTVTGNVTWSAGTVNATGTLSIVQTGSATTFSTSGTAALDGGSIQTSSPVTINALATSNSPQLTTTSTITLGTSTTVSGTGATFTAAGVNTTGGSPQTYGFGSDNLVLTGGTTTVASGNTLASGLVTITGGTLQDDGTVGSAVTLTGGTLDGTGTVSGNLTNTSGTVSPGDPPGTGVLSVTGTYSQGAGGMLAIQINGTAVSSGYAQLNATGAATLGGTLSLTGSLNPPATSTYNVLTYASLTSGTFTVTGSAAAKYFVTYGSTAVTLKAVPTSCIGIGPSFDAYTATSGSWSTGANWSSGASPTMSQVACWDAGQVVTADGSDTAALINASGDLTIAGGTLSLASTSTDSIVNNLSFASGGALNGPSGRTLTVAGIADTGTSSVTGLNVHLAGGGTSNVAGSLTLPQLSTDSGTVVPVGSGGTLSVENGTIGGAITGAGTFTAGTPSTGGTTTIASTGTISTAGVQVEQGNLTVQSGATYSAATSTSVGAGTLSFADASPSTGDLSLTGPGQLNGNSGSTLTMTGAFAWSGGAINAPSGGLAINQTGGGAFSISGASTLPFDGGSITTTSPVSLNTTHLATANTATLTTSSTITLTAGATVSGTGATFSAAGVHALGGSPQTYGFGANNLKLTGGTTTVAGGNTMTGQLTITGGTVNGTGTLGGSVTNNGTVSPGVAPGTGVLTVAGPYTQGNLGTLAILVSGTTLGTGFSQLHLNGSASLGGSLSVTDGGGFIPEPGNTFAVVTSPSATPTGSFTLTGPGKDSYTARYDLHDVTLTVKPTPGNTDPPAITGTPSVGRSLRCSNGSWSAFPDPNKFKYQWNRDGSAISGATNPTYVVSTADQGHGLTCTVTASNGIGPGPPATSAPVSVPAPAPKPLAPESIGAPTLSGTPTPGNPLTCSKGVWSGVPTGFKYQWARNGSNLAGATNATYTVQIADEGNSLTCTVTASNSVGSGAPSTSAAIVVAEPGTLTCAKPTGRLSGATLGALKLDFTRARARRAITRFTGSSGFDDFCLYGGWGIHAGYPSNGLLRKLSARERRRVRGKIVLAMTVNPYYDLQGARPGMPLAAVARRLKVGKAVHRGPNAWYFAPGKVSHGVLKVRGGIIQEVGIANKVLTHGSAAQKRFVAAFAGA